MKSFHTYRNIRKKALIYGLPVHLFALMMISVIGSLLVIIFSFGVASISLGVLLNLALYWLLLKLSSRPQLLRFGSVFPQMISNKKKRGL